MAAQRLVKAAQGCSMRAQGLIKACSRLFKCSKLFVLCSKLFTLAHLARGLLKKVATYQPAGLLLERRNYGALRRMPDARIVFKSVNNHSYIESGDIQGGHRDTALCLARATSDSTKYVLKGGNCLNKPLGARRSCSSSCLATAITRAH